MADSINVGQRVENSIKVTLTGTVGQYKIAQLDGTLASTGEYGFPALEGGSSGDKIALQLSGVARLLTGGAVTAGDAITSDSGGLAVGAIGSGVIIGRALASAASGDYVMCLLGYN